MAKPRGLAMSFALFVGVFRFVWRYWTLAPWLFMGVVTARVAATTIDAIVPLAFGWLVDAVTAPGVRDPWPAARAMALFFGMLGAFQILRAGNDFMLNRLTSGAMLRLVRDAFSKVQRFSADWHANAFAGATVRKITRGMWAFDSLTDVVNYGLMPAVIVVVAVTVTLSLRRPMLGVSVAIGIALFVTLSVSLSVAWIAPANAWAQEYDSRISATLADSISGHPVVAAFAAEAREDARLEQVVQEWRRRTLVAWNRGVATGLIQNSLLLPLQAWIIGWGVWLWSRGLASPGDVAGLMSTQFLLNGYLREIGQHVRNLQRAVNEMEDVVAFDGAEIGVFDHAGARDLVVERGEIVFDQVTFKYDGASAALYENLCLRLRPGERVGLVGRSGSGKSTFVKLIQRLYDLERGRILIDGQDIAQVTQASLRASVGVVAQEPMLFHRSLADNIGYGRPTADLPAVRAAASMAHANGFIAALAKGYDTLVGERGVKLSGGERQRIAIARAILAATPILILDEATSSLDTVSEKLIREAIEKLSHGRTTIVVAHRLSTVRQLDRILVFDQGRIVEDGSHAQLLARPNGVYRRLFDTQADSVFEPLAKGA